MKVHPKNIPAELGEAIRFDGSAESAAAIVIFCGRDHARLSIKPGDGAGALFVQDVAVPSGAYVVNPYRGGFLVLSESDFAAAWEIA